jgi:hypothetical protein
VSNIYCLWYPTGGFGHWLAAVISLRAHGFARPTGPIEFSPTGDTHATPLVAPKYCCDPDHYEFDFDPAYRYVVLIDNGITNENTKFLTRFPNANVIRVCYDNQTWPIIASTMLNKVMGGLDEILCPEPDRWPVADDWARREKYFLFLRDHDLRHQWRPSQRNRTFFVNDLLDHRSILSRLRDNFYIDIDDISDLWQQWRTANAEYVDPVVKAKDIMYQLRNNGHYDLHTVKDIWTQSVINYFIWLEYGVEVPANDYSDWFQDWRSLCQLLEPYLD